MCGAIPCNATPRKDRWTAASWRCCFSPSPAGWHWLGCATAALPVALSLHLGAVMALFATLPYGKFAHGIFRSAALLR